ncbi:zinc finger protein 511 isoform X1 [Pseudopipra pipra]|uniref:zinc finger protein 511 isoform X1 n=1 Tax=Pseudopipra pipra TaxID=415032 RepID=UPI003139FDEA
MAALPLPPGLRRRLREGIPQDPARELLREPPQLPAQPLPPFTFAPRRLRLGPQHPLLEVRLPPQQGARRGVLQPCPPAHGPLCSSLGRGRAQAPLPAGRPHQPRGGGRETQAWLSRFPRRVSEFSCHISGCCQVFDTLEGYEHHYNSLHRNVCSFCKRSFPSGNLLDIHILEWHDSLFQIMAEKQNMYKCLVEGCPEKFKSSKDRKDHLVTVHLYPADFRFDRPKKVKSVPKHTSCPTEQGPSVPMEVSVETAGQFQLDPMETGPAEDMEIPQPAASPGPSLPEKRLYRSRIPSTICFGQGATRGFKGPRKKV